jgi:hypothetical protein
MQFIQVCGLDVRGWHDVAAIDRQKQSLGSIHQRKKLIVMSIRQSSPEVENPMRPVHEQRIESRRPRWLRRYRLWCLSLACAFGVFPQASVVVQAQELEAVYVVLGPDGPVARVVVAGATQCPAIAIDSAPRAMSIRAKADADFPVLVCEAQIPADANSASIQELTLPLPKGMPNAIVVFGDTGCRLKAEKPTTRDANDMEDAGKFQDCDGPSKWPFAKLSETVANARPDLVIHVGDYLYRESPCPAGKEGCQGSPYGDNWQTWKADFFGPAAALLRVAPWIMTRGNHETCKRAGKGYFRLLEPMLANQTPPTCRDLIHQYTVTVGDKPFIVLDTSDAADRCSPKNCDSVRYSVEFASMKPAPGTWLVSHRPVWGIKHGRVTLNDTLENALRSSNDRLPAGIDLVLSGHIHIWEMLSFADHRSPQFVLGNGGTLLTKPITKRLKNQKIGGTEVKRGRSRHSWGYTIFSPGRDRSDWTATLFDITGKRQLSCRLKAAEVNCN